MRRKKRPRPCFSAAQSTPERPESNHDEPKPGGDRQVPCVHVLREHIPDEYGQRAGRGQRARGGGGPAATGGASTAPTSTASAQAGTSASEAAANTSHALLARLAANSIVAS